MRPVSAGFAAQIISQKPSHLDRRFTWGAAGRSQYVNPYGVITLDAKQVVANAVSLPLINTTQIWNTILTNRPEMTNQGVVELGIRVGNTMQYVPFFTGNGDRVHFVKDTLTIQMRDKMAAMLRITVGSTAIPVVYDAAAWNPADLVWSILINYGGLSGAGAGNVDIDWTLWNAWQTDMATFSLQLRGRFTGQTIGWILQRVSELTSTVIFVRGDGRFVFYRYVPPPAIFYTITNNNSRNPEVEQTLEEIKNDVTCEWGWDGANWGGASPVNITDPISIGNYGTYYDVEEDTIIWHEDAASATDYCNRILERYADPRQYFIFETGLMGFILEPGDIFFNSVPFYGYTNVLHEIVRCEFDLQTGMVKIRSINAEGYQVLCFTLDDVYAGLLDQAYNPLC